MATITLRWGENPITDYKDVTEDPSIVLFRPDRNFGNQPFLYINPGSRESRALIKFDLQNLGKWISSVDDITSASLVMYVNNANIDSVILNIRRVKKLWNEGNKNNNDAVVGEVTWNSQSYGDSTSDIPWTVGGCKGSPDRNDTIEDSITLTSADEGTWITFDVITAVKYSYTTGLFYGFIIEHLSGNGNQIAFNSSSNVTRRPYLEVVVDGQSSSSSSSASSSSSSSSSRSSSSSSRSSSSSSSRSSSSSSSSAADPGEAGQDLTNWSTVDPNGDFTLTSPTRIDFATMQESAIAYAYYDFGAGFFANNSFEMDIDITISAETGDSAGIFFGLSNTLGTLTALDTANDGMGVSMLEGAANLIDSRTQDYATAQSASILLHALSTRYYRFTWNGTDFNAIMYTTAGRTIVLDSSGALTGVDTTPFRYLILGNVGAGTTDTVTGRIENLVITNRGV